MGLSARELADFAGTGRRGRKIGDVLSGRFDNMDVDSVEEIRKLRERK
jgi:hypothetical protein